MAWGKKTLTASAEPPERPRSRNSLVASALRFRFEDSSYGAWRFRDEAWQRELWRLYDITPELRFAASWVGQCCSQVRIYVAKVDELGRIQGEATDPKIAALSDTLLGGPKAKAEHLRMMGINLTIAGECYIVGRPDDLTGRDAWWILSPTEFRKVRGANGEWEWAWGMKDAPFKLDVERNIVTRVWTPHPVRVWCADSPARSCQIILRELEQLTKYVASQIDSRLISGGIFIIPNDLDMPQDDTTTNNADSLMIRLATAAAASLRGEGTALAVLPHIIEANNPDGFRLINFDSELSKVALELRKEAIERLGVGMDMPAEVLKGVGDSNHWNGFLIDGYGIKVHIEPLMNRICDALTQAYLIPALRLMGKDPGRYTYQYDTSPLQLRPQRGQDALNLYEKDIISAEAVRAAMFFKESDAPNGEEAAKRILLEVLLRDPQLIQNQAIREAVGITEEILPQTAMIAPTAQSVGLGAGGGSGPPPPPPPPTGIRSALPPPIPNTLGNLGAAPRMPNPGGQPGPVPSAPLGTSAPVSNGGAPPNGLRASSANDPGMRQLSMEQMGVVVAANATVQRGLELAGKRLLTGEHRHSWTDVPAHELHTRIRVRDQARVNRLLAGAWDQLDLTIKVFSDNFDTQRLRLVLEQYCAGLLLRAEAHEPEFLFEALQLSGIIDGK